jgi:hypothetical protein
VTSPASADLVVEEPITPEPSAVRKALAWWALRSLRLGTLRPPGRAAAIAGILTITAMTLLLFAWPLGIEPPGGAIVTGDLGRIPRAVLIGVYLALGVTAGCLAVAIRLRRGTPLGARAGLVAIGLAGAALAATGISAIAPVATGVALLGVGAGLGLAIAAAIGRLPGAGRVACWAATPLALACVAFVLPVTPPFAVTFGIRQQDIVGERMATVAANLTAPIVLLGIWGSIEYSRILVRGWMGVTRRSSRLTRATVGGILAAKLTWLVLAHSRILPPALGGHAHVVGPSPLEAPVAWAVALCAGGLAAGWLLGRRRIVAAPRGAVASAWVVGIGLVAGFASVQLALIVLQVWLTAAPATQLPDAVVALLGSAGRALIWVPAITVLAAGLGGVVLLWRGRRAPGIFLLGTFIWAVPRVLGIAIETTTGVRLEEPAGTRLGVVDLATLDATVTAGVCGALVVAMVSGRRPPIRAAAVIVLVSTTLAYAPRLLTPELAVAAFWLSLVFPIFVRLAFNAEPLNRDRAGRTGRVLVVIGTATGSIGLASLLAWTGGLSPDATTLDELGSLILLVPVTTLFVAAALAAPPRRHAAPGDGSAYSR